MHWICNQVAATLVTFVLIARAVAADAVVADLEPEPARVVTAGAAVRSGPGENYYLTDTLPEDATVEIYRREPDGWCAIRPPAESFSWVFAQHVRLMGDGLAEINKDDVPSRVGSRLSSQRNTVHIRLQQGETVQVVGQDDRDGQNWYKVAPPAGEFRWVHAKDLAPADPSRDGPEPDRAVAPASHDQPAVAAANEPSADLAPPPLATAGEPPTAAKVEQPSANHPPPSTDVTPIGAEPVSSADLSRQLDDLELRLSRMVAEPTATWNVSALEQAAEQLLPRSDTVADREAVKRTLAKIDQFALIQRRFLSMNGLPAGAISQDVAANRTAAQGQPLDTAADPATATTSQYDAVGILRPVVSRRPGAPQFALVNDAGQVVTFVTAAPDMNLQPYLGRRIGVTGTRGYIPEFRRAHVTAGRVSPLNDRMMR